MIEGEFEGLKAMHAVSPDLVPTPYAWGRYGKQDPETYYLLTEFRDVGEQLPDSSKFAARLPDLHRASVSPTGKFGFHITTCIDTVPQRTDCWEKSWAKLFQRQLAHMIILDFEKNEFWPEFKVVCNLILDKVIPRLLEPLQAEGRAIRPCLIHGSLWDDSIATDLHTGEPFVFNPSAMYGMRNFCPDHILLINSFSS